MDKPWLNTPQETGNLGRFANTVLALCALSLVVMVVVKIGMVMFN